MDGFSKDSRTIDKILNGVNDTYDDNNMWLAPYINPKVEYER